MWHSSGSNTSCWAASVKTFLLEVTSSLTSESTNKPHCYTAALHKAIQHLQVLNVNCWNLLIIHVFLSLNLIACTNGNHHLGLYANHQPLLRVLNKFSIHCHSEQESADQSSLSLLGVTGGSAVKIPSFSESTNRKLLDHWGQISMSTGLISPVLFSRTHTSLSLAGSTHCRSWSTGSIVWTNREQQSTEVSQYISPSR